VEAAFSFSFSDADVPPAEPAELDPLEPELPADSPPVSLFPASPVEPAEGVPSLEVLVDLLAVVDVEVVCAEAFSALVSVGGMMSGVLLGVWSEVLLAPPHALSVTPASATRHAASAARPDRALNCLPSEA
jgi:hypothetical protein